MPDSTLPKVSPIAKRVIVKLGKIRRSFLLVAPPWPKLDDMLTVDGQDWPVVSIKDEKVIAAFDRDGAKLTQVFP